MSALTLLAAATRGGPGASPEPPDPPGPTVSRGVADNVGVYRTGSVITAQTTYVSPHIIRREVTRIRVLYGSNWWGTLGTQVNLTLSGAAVVVNGVLYPLVFSGSASRTITPGTVAISDWVTVAITAGTVITSRTCWGASSLHPTQAFLGLNVATGGGHPIAPLGNYTTAGSGAVPLQAGVLESGHGPLMIEGSTTSTSPSVAIIGDSIAEGFQDTAAGFKSGGLPSGFLPLGMHPTSMPYTNFGVFADTPPVSGLGREGRFGDTLLSHTHAICEYPINLINGAQSFASITSSLLNLYTYVIGQGPKLYQTTLSPSNTSTDSWATLGNQTVNAGESVRVAFNNWLRDGAPTVAGVAVAAGSVDPTAKRAGAVGHQLSGYVEVADSVESARNSGKWKVTGAAGYATADGTHPSPAAHALMAAPITAWAASL